MSLTIQNLEDRIKEYEQEIAKIVANHGTLVGGLNELKQLLSIASSVVSVVDPAAEPIVEVVSEIVDEAIAIATPVAPASKSDKMS